MAEQTPSRAIFSQNGAPRTTKKKRSKKSLKQWWVSRLSALKAKKRTKRKKIVDASPSQLDQTFERIIDNITNLILNNFDAILAPMNRNNEPISEAYAKKLLMLAIDAAVAERNSYLINELLEAVSRGENMDQFERAQEELAALNKDLEAAKVDVQNEDVYCAEKEEAYRALSN